MGQIVKVYKDGVGYQVLNTNNIGDALEAGDNISINGNEISAVDTTYSAGTGLSLSGTTFSLNINYGADLSLSIDPSTFVLTAQLKDQNGSNIGSAQTIDLPLESVVVSGTYNAQTKEVELTLQSGSVIRFSVADLVSGLQEELVVGDGINIDANNEISVDTSVIATKEYVDDSIAEYVSSGPTAPSNPTQGMLRYDTVNDVLKSYDGSNWNEVGNESADINTKTFHLSGTSDLTNAQAAYDWFSAGKNPIVMYNNRAYLLYAKNATQLIFQDIENSAYNQNSYTEYVGQKIIFTLSGNDVTAINYNSTSGWSGPILRTDVDYPTPYTPTYEGSPATKQYVDNNDTYIGTSAPTDNVVEGRLWYDTTNDVLKVYDGTNWNEVNTDTTYTAGTGISIDANNVISNTQISAEWGNITGTLSDQTDLQNALNEKQNTLTAGNHIDITNNTISTTGLQEELIAGENITIGDECTTESDMEGPCPKGFHIPTGTEWGYLATVSNSFGLNTRQTVSRYFKMPLCGQLDFSTGAHEREGIDVQLWASNASIWQSIVTTLYLWSGATIWTTTTGYGFCIRPMKNSPVVPDSTWTVLYDGSSVAVGAGIFHSPTEELISYSNDGTTWQTIADKNLGATVAYTYGDTMSESNCGKFYQRGNNHGFPYTGATTTSSVQTDTSGYGPGNYYSSDVFITSSTRISPWNGDLRGGVTQGTFQDCIHNVISAIDTTYTAGTGINIDANNVISATATPGQTYTAGNGINISQNNEISADTTVVATKTDLNTKQDTLTAGENTSIENICESDMQGPCPSGFHVPTVGEWNGLINIMKNALSLQYGPDWMQYLHMPYAGQRDCESSNVDRQRIEGFYATSIFDDATPSFSGAFFLLVRAGDTVYVEEYGLPVAMGFSVRGFKNEYVTPTSSWTVVQGTLGSAGIFRDQTNGLISITDGTTGYTIMDKNLGATTVYNNGDTLSEANCGKYYQWGNNYGFPRSGSITTSSTQVDASGYGPGNYYSSNTFITTSTSPFDWSSVENKNLRGGVSQGTWCRLTISATDTKYTAGTNVQISNQNVISATDTKYTAGTGISIDANNVISNTQTSAEWGNITGTLSYQTDLQDALDEKQDVLTAGDNVTIEEVCIDISDMQGPAPDGFHVPLNTEWQSVYDIWTALGGSNSDGTNFGIALKLPFAGSRSSSSANVNSQGNLGRYWSSSPSLSNADYARYLYFNSSGISPQNNYYRANGVSVRCFKNSPTVPTSSWTKLYGTSIESGGIFWSSADGLISLSSDGQTWITIADKNLGATTVWNNGDTLSEANCGKYYQRGNNYGFSRTGSVTTSSTQVDASTYGPGNYYNSDTFITGSNDWSNVHNDNLWGGITQQSTQSCSTVISAQVPDNAQWGNITGTLSNQTDLNTALGGKQDTLIAGSNIQIAADGYTISAIDTTYTAGTGINISNQNVISADTTVVATQTDVNNKVSKGTNQINSQLFSIEDTYGNSANFGPDYIRIDFNDGTNSGSAGLQRDSLGATANNKISNLTSDSLALKDDLNLTQTTYAEDEITVVDNGYGTSETYQFSGGGNNQIARLKDVKTYTASTGISIDANNQISNTLPGPTIAATAPTGTEGALWYDTTNDVLMAHDGTSWKEAGTQMKVLSYGHSTWQDFLNAYNENAIVYCRASSNSNPGSGVQGRMAFMAFVSLNSSTGVPQNVEFQYYRSRSDHNSQANQLDQVFVYTLTPASGGTWTVTERNTGAKAVAGTGINLAFGSGNMTISADTTTLATKTDLNSKQDTLVSGTNIKSINNESLLGTGNITIPIAEIGLSTATGNLLTSGAKIWVGDETDLPTTPNSNTVYLCAEQTSGTPRLPSAYQEVEYIESGTNGGTQYINFRMPYYDSEGYYSFEIDAGNVGNAEGILLTVKQALGS